MPTIDLDPTKVDALFQKGHISQDVYDSIMAPHRVDLPQSQPLYAMNEPRANINPNPSPAQPTIGQSGLTKDQMKNAWENGFSLENGQIIPNTNDVTSKKRALATKAGISEDVINQKLGAPKSLNLASDVGKAPKAQAASSMSPYDAGYNKQIQGVNDAATAAAQKTDAQSAALNNYMKQADDLEKDRQANEIFRQGQMDLAIKDLDDSTNAVAAMKVDPNHFWANAATANKILMGVSLALGAFGAANDGVNRVVPIITGAIDRDIAAQKANMAQAREGVNQKSNSLTQMRSVFKDERMAEEAAKIAALEKVKMQVMQKSMQYSRPEVQANAKKLVGELDVKKAEARQKFLQAAKNGGLDRALTPGEQLSVQKYNDERQTPFGIVKDPREAPKIRDMKGIVDPLRANLKDLEDVTKEGRSWLPFSERTDRAKVLATDTQLQMKELARLGVLSQGDLELMQKMIPSDPTAIMQSNADERIKEAHKLVLRKWKAYIEARGLKDPTLDDPKR